jgi:hypothetical protein
MQYALNFALGAADAAAAAATASEEDAGNVTFVLNNSPENSSVVVDLRPLLGPSADAAAWLPFQAVLMYDAASGALLHNTTNAAAAAASDAGVAAIDRAAAAADAPIACGAPLSFETWTDDAVDGGVAWHRAELVAPAALGANDGSVALLLDLGGARRERCERRQRVRVRSRDRESSVAARRRVRVTASSVAERRRVRATVSSVRGRVVCGAGRRELSSRCRVCVCLL